MTPEERRRAGRAVGERIALLGTTPAKVAEECNLDTRTLRGLISGRTWPTAAVRNSIEDAIGWPRGAILLQARDGLEALGIFTDAELAAELLHRLRRRENIQQT